MDGKPSSEIAQLYTDVQIVKGLLKEQAKKLEELAAALQTVSDKLNAIHSLSLNSSSQLTLSEKVLVDLANNKYEITVTDAAPVVALSRTRTSELLNSLARRGMLVKTKRGKTSVFRTTKDISSKS